MPHLISLAHLTVLSLAPPDMIEVAARTGYGAVGLRMIAVTPTTPCYPLMSDPVMLRETRAAVRRTGIAVNDIEFVKITPDLDVASLEPFLAAGAELGAKHVIAAPYDEKLDRLADRLSALADLARPYGMTALLEFFPWTVVPDFAAARRLVAATRSESVGILVDALHFRRSESSLDLLDATPKHLLPFAHLCDAASEAPADVDAMLHTARSERLPPGDGGLAVAEIVARLPTDIPLGIEVPMDALTRAAGPEEVARRCRDAVARLLSGLSDVRHA